MRACGLSNYRFLSVTHQLHGILPTRSAPRFARIVGAIADGAIIEQGSNANGEYVRFANGLQICLKRFYNEGGDSVSPIGITILNSGWYNSPQTLWAFPATFVDSKRVCFCSGLYSAEGNYVRIVGVTYAGGNGGCYYNFIAPMSFTAQSDIFFTLGAIGKWK